MSEPTEPQTDAAAIDTDLYCVECGYNLRGLSGDPVRCPECGYHNPLGDVKIPAEIITRQLREMESPLATCALSALLGLPFLAAVVVTACEAFIAGTPFLTAALCPALLGAGLLALWLRGVHVFRR